MSLDVYLTMSEPNPGCSTGIFVRQDGATREITRAEWDERFPGTEPVVAQSDELDRSVYSANITHNLGTMAREAGIYMHLWRPDEIGVKFAGELIGPLSAGLAELHARPEYFEAFNSPNGWGLYKNFVPFVSDYLDACQEHPDAEVSVSR
jgi:hypothetical protein